MLGLIFSSTIPAKFFRDLEDLIFFNGEQWRARGAIVEALERYGEPRIVREDETLRVDVTRRQDAQCLFALVEEDDFSALAGIVIYLRTDIETLHILYLAVSDGFSLGDNTDAAPLVLGLVQEIRRIAGRLHGVRRVTLMKAQGGNFHITVRREPQARPADIAGTRVPAATGVLITR